MILGKLQTNYTNIIKLSIYRKKFLINQGGRNMIINHNLNAMNAHRKM